ncbi:hypothetical protein AB0478_45715 [Streptomyces sp. NPDC051917]|uniref:hypothetical protein n=1 Tax=Streptomyces sp. NPDC051917 TaxID=3154754 RepID=UPI003452E085
MNRVVFLDSFFGSPTEETPPPTGFATFPLQVNNAGAAPGTWQMPPEREAAYTGHVVPGSKQQL